ncbi:DUF2935 domain-containing protein [Defluviitalea phaphyphila]|uniref:DUF2935 domain-containing protein n=1 Tax=Defluviitalea phaphyphila TaxID=1473580 RepID=UPI00073165D1|nr:DUF2935 domain-containing protein [Defluviitalea phaphyphila]
MNGINKYFIKDILDQIIFWTEISKEHPIVIDTVAQLTDKNLPKKLTKEVLSYTSKFEDIQKRARHLQRRIEYSMPYMQGNILREICLILRDFIALDQYWINLLETLKDYGEDDKIWQTLIEHIKEEQIYAYNLMRKYYQRICY